MATTNKPRSYEPHPLCAIFKLMPQPALEELADDIKANGQKLPIILYEHKILDGRNRDIACKMVGVKPNYADYRGSDPLAFVTTANMHRRHMTDADRAIAAAKLKVHFEASAKGRKQDGATLGQDCPKGKAIEQAAESIGAAPRSAQSAATVLENATPEVIEAMEDHTVSIADAAAVASEPPEAQREAVKKVRKKKAKTLKAAIAEAEQKEEDAEPAAELTTEEQCEADNKLIESFCRSLVKFFDDNVPKTVWSDTDGRIGSALASLKAGCTTLRGAKAVLCPQCVDGEDRKGNDCQYCKAIGYLPKFRADQIAGINA